MSRVIYTVGHSNLDEDAFFALLAGHGIERLADVRAHPGSRRRPHFARDALAESCGEHGIEYHWMPELGGRRKGRGDDSPHVGWEVPAFRAYADYADTEDFAAALRELVESDAVTAYACAEAKWWQCHRRLISDTLLVMGFAVRHIVTPKRWNPHRLPDFARVADGRIVYDAGTTGTLAL